MNVTLSQALSQPAAVCDYLTYRSYKFNRESFPHVPVLGWAFVFGDVSAFEKRYQAELREAE